MLTGGAVNTPVFLVADCWFKCSGSTKRRPKFSFTSRILHSNLPLIWGRWTREGVRGNPDVAVKSANSACQQGLRSSPMPITAVFIWSVKTISEFRPNTRKHEQGSGGSCVDVT